MSVKSLITEQHLNGEETEFYPTTQEIVDCISEKISKNCSIIIYSILDIGCGNGNFFEKLDRTKYFHNSNARYDEAESKYKLSKNYKKFGIEKSVILYNNCPDDVILLGTDFMSNTLLDKKVDMIFCNPPYSQYEIWTEKIIKECNSKNIVLVIPSRWKNNKRILDYIEKRNMKYDVWGNFDFNNAERKARCNVDIVYIHNDDYRYETDPFDLWFEETFKINAEQKESYRWDRVEEKKKNIKNEIINSDNIAETLVQLYNKEMDKLYSNYKYLENLDQDIFVELNINIGNLKKSLKERIDGLKHLYWNELFDHYSKITSRLTSFKRQEILKKLNDNIVIDFTTENIYQLTLWIIRNSNKIFDEQLKEYFYSLCNTESIQRYKSNKRWNDDDWKYIKENITQKMSYWDREKKVDVRTVKNIALDYRIVVQAYSNFEYDSWNKIYKNRFTDDGYNFLMDTQIIAQNLGFNVNILSSDRTGYSSRETNAEYWKNTDIFDYEGNLFCNLKLYKNGNRHIKFNKNFIMKLNIEMARINKWINDKSEAAQEFDVSESEINALWKSNLQIGLNDTGKLLGLPCSA